MTTLAAGDNPGTILLGFAIWAAILAAYLAPSIIALARRVPNAGSVVVVDMLLGWTVIGWIVALAMALRSKPSPRQWMPPYYPQPPGQ